MMLKRSEIGNDAVDFDSDHPLLLYKEMFGGGFPPDGHTFMYLLKMMMVCGSVIGAVEQVHSCLLKSVFGTSEFVSSVLLMIYENGHEVFDEMSDPGVVVWTAMIRTYVQVKSPDLFRRMECDLMPDPVAFATVVSACGLAKDLRVAKAVHGFVIICEVVVDEVLGIGVSSMYVDGGSLDLTYRIFKEILRKKLNNFVWNCMIFQCVQHDQSELARELFASMPNKDVVTWNTLIQGLCRVSQHKEALALFHNMESEGVKASKQIH